MPASAFEKIYKIIRRIPKGKVATYGQIAAMAGYERGARTVGWALNYHSGDDLPWHRVINAGGKSSLPEGRGQLQKALLEIEDIVFDQQDRIDLKKYLWNGIQRK